MFRPCGPMARRLTTNQEIPGSTPGMVNLNFLFDFLRFFQLLAVYKVRSGWHVEYRKRVARHLTCVLPTHPMSTFSIAQLAIPGVATLISFLSYGSQILFSGIGPYPLNRSETIAFNALICSIWICYFQACFVDPGAIPSDWIPQALPNPCTEGASQSDATPHQKQRWCRKCKVIKPPRAHHCRSCGRYAINHSSSTDCPI